MRKRKLIKPRKVVWVMRDFVNSINSVTYTDYILPPPSTKDETAAEYFARLKSAQEVEYLATIVLKESPQDRGFAVCISDIGEPTISMWYDIENLWDRGSAQFARDFYSRCPMGRGFATITITLLHELGHIHSQQEFDGYNRVAAIQNLHKQYAKEVINFEYFKLPDEKAATDWAIEWLANAENRKMAKAFEKEFFKCFAK